MKKLFLKGISYVGLYAEIASATCRWVAAGRRTRWRSAVTLALVASGYLPPTLQEKMDRMEYRAWLRGRGYARKQSVSIQQCLKVNPYVLRLVRGSANPDEHNAIHGH